MTDMILLAAAEVAGQTAQMAVQAAEAAEGISVWTMIVKGGWLMIPIFLLSVIAVYIFFERYLLIRKYACNNASFMEQLKKYVSEGRTDEAADACRQEDTPMSRMLLKGVIHSNLPLGELRSIMESKANLEVSSLEKGLSTLATCSGMAPMIGFLGTVVGMVQAFYDMAMAGSNINITLLSRGIYTAMITTVAGLIVGIIAYFAYNAITARIDRIVNNMENCSAEFMETVYALKNRE